MYMHDNYDYMRQLPYVCRLNPNHATRLKSFEGTEAMALILTQAAWIYL